MRRFSEPNSVSFKNYPPERTAVVAVAETESAHPLSLPLPPVRAAWLCSDAWHQFAQGCGLSRHPRVISISHPIIINRD